MKKTMFWLAAAALALGLVFAGCSLFDWLSGDDDDETEEPAGIVYSFDPKAEGMEPWQVVISPDAAYFRLPGIERPGYRLYWHNLETGAYIAPNKRLLFSSPLWTRNCRFEAEWERLIYIIAYHEGGGQQSAPSNPFHYNIESEDIHLFPLTKEGWMFGGWYDNAACTGDPVTVIPRGSTGNKEFWAKWVDVSAINLSSPPASGTTDVGWDYAGGVYTIHDGANIIITGTTTRDRIAVSGTATITLDGASITLNNDGASPLYLGNGANLTLKLSSTNTLTAGDYGAGVHAPAGTTLTITSAAGDGQTSGTLTARGGYASAGIGGRDWGGEGGTITIAGGTVNTTGGDYSAGIGGGYKGEGGNITISGGTITATSTCFGAGIGGGYESAGGVITISGSAVVNAAGNQGSAGIGGGWYGSGGTIRIFGGTITAATGGEYGAGIGGGYQGEGGNITISDGSVNAVSGIQGAGIGGGSDAAGGTISISGGNITARSTYMGAGIGGGSDGAGGTINISGGNVTAVAPASANDPAGIGGGAGGNSGDISITGGTGSAASEGGGRGVGPGAPWRDSEEIYGAFSDKNGGHTWPTGNAYSW